MLSCDSGRAELAADAQQRSALRPHSAVCLIIIGPPDLMPFSLAITFGLLNATYTTLLICSPLWYFLHWVVLRGRGKAGGGNKAGAETGVAASTGGDATPLKGSSFQSKGSDDAVVRP